MTDEQDEDAQVAGVALFLTSATLDPSAVTKLLGTDPTMAAAPGEDPVALAEGYPDPPGYWTREHECPTECSLDDAVELVLEAYPADSWIWDELDAIADVNLICTVATEAPLQTLLLDPDHMRVLAARHIRLVLRIVGPFLPHSDV